MTWIVKISVILLLYYKQDIHVLVDQTYAMI